jgi:hypothetical protein
MTTTPLDALATLETMAADGRLAAFCADHGVGLLVAFGSAVAVRDGDVDLAPRDLDRRHRRPNAGCRCTRTTPAGSPARRCARSAWRPTPPGSATSSSTG